MRSTFRGILQAIHLGNSEIVSDHAPPGTYGNGSRGHIMANSRIQKFGAIESALRCPRCGQAVHLEGTSLRCEGGHCYNVSSKGSVNFVPDARPVDHYDLESYERRRLVMEAGLYYPVVDMLLGELEVALITSTGTSVTSTDAGHDTGDVHGAAGDLGSAGRWLVLDAGCGEGYFTRALHDHMSCAMDTDEA